ncbi:hypothetical protein KIW84_058442 [Lathyrus oleraceus]|uniref:Uncharacterized protein n=1 Tax=Pisum sativum TaxID=3888 RepID=A0A9D4X6D2_PEA|nr:hypothetical protein KIW84_058442 [Pisum sativum]
MFTASCFSTRSSSEYWLINSGCTNHMTYDKTLFKDLKPTKVSKVRIGNGSYISAKGKGTILISTTSGIKTISDVLYVPDIDQNLLTVGQLIEKGFKVSFENQHCVIFDTTGGEILKVKRDKLDKKAISGIFVGYSSVSKAYEVYHPQSGKVIVSRDVHFNEDQQWDWKNPQRTIGSFNNIGNDHLEKQTTELCENELEDDPPPLEAQGCCLTSINSAM